MPDASRKEIPTEYIEEADERPGGDGAKWEAEQLMDAVFHVGAKDAHAVRFFVYSRVDTLRGGE